MILGLWKKKLVININYYKRCKCAMNPLAMIFFSSEYKFPCFSIYHRFFFSYTRTFDRNDSSIMPLILYSHIISLYNSFIINTKFVGGKKTIRTQLFSVANRPTLYGIILHLYDFSCVQMRFMRRTILHIFNTRSPYIV